jgi:hypothetical protein
MKKPNLDKLLSGEEESDDPTIAFLLKKMKAAASEGVQSTRQLVQMEQGVAQLKERITALTGICSEHRQSIEELVAAANAPDPDPGEDKKPDLKVAPKEEVA